MKLKTRAAKSIFGILEKEHKTTLDRIDEFYDALKRLRYEGKLNLGRNLAEVRGLATYFRKELDGHMREEERVLFPFLRTHIPRLEPLVALLLSEHDDFRGSLEGLEAALEDFKRHEFMKSSLIEKICEHGTYLICLLRSHMWVESHNLYKAADRELRPDEKKSLILRISG